MPKWASSIYRLKKRKYTEEKKKWREGEHHTWVTNILEFVHTQESLKPLSPHHICHCAMGCDLTMSIVQSNLKFVDEGAIPAHTSGLTVAAASQTQTSSSSETYQLKPNNKSRIWKSFRFWILKLLSHSFLISAVSWEKMILGPFFFPQIHFLGQDSWFQGLRRVKELSLQLNCIILEGT